MITPYHSQYFAYELTRRWPSDRMEKLSQSLFNATVDLNPHQLDAALFAFNSPLSRGALLADEVGLGKTIEAGLIIAQLWAERKRRILCILPAALRKQWNRELIEKFFIPSAILETARYNQVLASGVANPFDQPGTVVLCSYQFARAKAAEIAAIDWDLVVLDEAHRLRNVYKKANKIARSIRDSIGSRPKVLLTATPLQNSLMELYGLVTFVDPHIFGSEDTFRQQFSQRAKDMTAREYAELRERIRPICQRTLRRQVTEYIQYTKRLSITQDFTPTDDEVRLYDAVSSYLQRASSIALPAAQRSLITLVLRKILASSSFAIAATLGKIIRRLELEQAARRQDAGDALADVAEDYDTADELSDEAQPENGDARVAPVQPGTPSEETELRGWLAAARREAAELTSYKSLAESITTNAKGDALLLALERGFAKLADLGAPRKALIFTESRRTQVYLRDLLAAIGHADQIVLVNSSNTDPESRRIYAAWRERHRGEDVVTGSTTADLRSALMEEFRDRASIMIATESGAEGVNLQFCSLVVNYDLPWNPQRIEQRIGRCHRYGQKFDVVVINFLNRRNAADQRVFELLSEKFKLFDGVFGASDEVLGVLESGVDFEQRINEIYQSCRTETEINTAFDQLQVELDSQIEEGIEDARRKLLEHFDEDVHHRLRTRRDDTADQVGKFERWLLSLSRYELGDNATFDANGLSFELRRTPAGLTSDQAPTGAYRLVTKSEGDAAHHYRLGHPLAEHLIQQAKSRELPVREVGFRYSNYAKKISVLEDLRGKSGWLSASLLRVEALEAEEHLLLAAALAGGAPLDAEVAEKLFLVDGELGGECLLPDHMVRVLEDRKGALRDRILDVTATRNRTYFESEMEKLEAWADDLKDSLESEIKELDREIKAAKRAAKMARDLEAKVGLYRKVKEMESRRTAKRRGLFEAQDEIDARKEKLIGDVEAKLKQRTTTGTMFTIRWCVV
jgi:superfamily II DNA or RNA helicase